MSRPNCDVVAVDLTAPSGESQRSRRARRVDKRRRRRAPSGWSFRSARSVQSPSSRVSAHVGTSSCGSLDIALDDVEPRNPARPSSASASPIPVLYSQVPRRRREEPDMCLLRQPRPPLNAENTTQCLVCPRGGVGGAFERPSPCRPAVIDPRRRALRESVRRRVRRPRAAPLVVGGWG